jgi:uncharacterized protein DUF4383
MNTKTFAWVFGVVFVLIGILGFVPALNPGGLLLGIFQVNAFHSVVHIVSGIAALVAAMTGAYYAKLYFKVFGVVYALVTVLGFLTGNGLFGLIPVNMADNLLHLVIAASSLYLGFMGSASAKAAPAKA